jgi:hypothetical protein
MGLMTLLRDLIRERDEAVQMLTDAWTDANPDQPCPDILTMIRSRIDARGGYGGSIDDILHGLSAESSTNQEPKTEHRGK